MSDRTATATVDGVTHEIPETWLVAFTQTGHQKTVQDAVYFWHWQWQLEQRELEARITPESVDSRLADDQG